MEQFWVDYLLHDIDYLKKQIASYEKRCAVLEKNTNDWKALAGSWRDEALRLKRLLNTNPTVYPIIIDSNAARLSNGGMNHARNI